jgi:oligopeptide transport system permease protein
MRKVSILFLLCLAAGILWISLFPQMSYETAISQSLEGPFQSSFLGRDSLGRDLFLRILQGAQISLGLGLSSSLMAMFFGLVYGGLAAMGPSQMDAFLMRISEVLMSLPSLMLMAVLALVLQNQLQTSNQFLVLFWVLSLTSWMSVAKLTRNLIRQEQSQDYVEAARAIGASKFRIFHKHLVPNLVSPVLIYWSLQIPHAILAEGLLSFLGFGVKSPAISWGALLQEGWTALASYPHLLLAPALILFLTVLALNILLENFRKSQDPKLKWEKYS